MTEISRPWGGIVTGDAGPYSDDQWMQVWETLMAPIPASEGVWKGQLNELILGALGATPITIGTGRAQVDGSWYENDALFLQAIVNPAANPYIARIVLRKDFTLQTIRITVLYGAEAAAPVAPAIVQNPGVTWDLPIWQVHVTAGGAITMWRDERDYIGAYKPTRLTTEGNYSEDDFDWLPALRTGGAIQGYANGDIIGHWLVITGGINGRLIPIVTATGYGELQFYPATNAGYVFISTGHVDPTNDLCILRFWVKVPNDHADMRIRCGYFGDTPTNAAPDPAEGIYFRVNGAGANWFAVTRTGGVETATDTTIAAGNAYRGFEIQVKASNVTFISDTVTRAVHTTNIPAGTLSAMIGEAHTSLAGGLPFLDLDRVNMEGRR